MATLSMAELAAQYGFAAAFFNADPELRKLIQAAVKGQWSTAKFQAKFMATTWYRSREASARQWADLMARDPTEAKNKINERKAELSDRFTQLGINIDDSVLATLAASSLQWSWSDAQTKNVLAGYAESQSGEATGGLGAIETDIRQMAHDYGVTVSDAQMRDWVSGIVGDEYTSDSLKGYLKDMAKIKYVGMSGYLDQGMTVRQVAAPYLQSYSQLMETAPDTIDLADPALAKALQGKADPKTGLPVMSTLYDFERDLRKDPRWLNTKNAHSSMTDMTIGVLKDMGLYG